MLGTVKHQKSVKKNQENIKNDYDERAILTILKNGSIILPNSNYQKALPKARHLKFFPKVVERKKENLKVF